MKVLCVSRSLPFPTTSGYDWRCLGLLRALAAAFDVTYMTAWGPCQTESDVRMAHEVVGRAYLKLLPSYGDGGDSLSARGRRALRAGAWRVPRYVIAHHQPGFAEALVTESSRHDAVVLLDNAVAIYWRSLTGARCRVADIHNVAGWSLSDVNRSDAPLATKLRVAADIRLMRSYERRWLSAMNAVTVTSSDEAERLRSLYGREADAVIPSTVDPPDRALRTVGSGKVGWLGTLDYAPNRNGLIRFVREGWGPLGDAGYELLVVGGGDSPEVRDLAAQPGIRLLGFVPSLDAILDQLAAAVVPLWEGAGVKLKTATFLAAGVPVVSTPVGVEGLGTVAGRNVLLADQPTELARQLMGVLADPPAATALGDAGRELILRDFSWNAIGRRFVSVIEQAVSRIGAASPDAQESFTPARFPREPVALVSSTATASASAPAIVCFATQGSDHPDQRRISYLLEPLQPTRLRFEPSHKRRMPVRLLRDITRRRPDMVVMEGTGLGGGVAVMAARLLGGVPYVVSSGDAVSRFLAVVRPGAGPAATVYERALYRLSAGFIGWSPYLVGRALSLGAPRGMTAAHFSNSRAEAGARQAVRARLEIPADAIVFGIAGSINMNNRLGYSYGVDLVRAIRRADRADVRVLIVGDGDGLTFLEDLAGPDLGRRILLPGRCPQAEVPDYLAAMDIATLSQSTDVLGAMRYTTKLPEYLAAGLPLVVTEVPAGYDLDTGWLWRLPGESPWDDVHIDALAQLMQRVSREEVEQKRARVPRNLELFDPALQQRRVCEFVRELTARATRTSNGSAPTRPRI